MVTLTTDSATAQVLRALKSGERTSQEFYDKKDKLASQGVNVEMIDKLLRQKGQKPRGEDVIPFLPEKAEKFLAETETLPIAGMIGGGLTGGLAGGGLASLATGAVGAGVGAAGLEAARQKLRQAKGYQKKMEPREILKQGLYGAGAELAGAGIVGAGKAILRPVLEPIAAAGMNVSKQALERTLARPIQVMMAGGEKAILQAGRKMTQAVNALKSISGKATRKEIDALAKITDKQVSTKGLTNYLQTQVARLNKLEGLPQVAGPVKTEVDNIIKVLNRGNLSLDQTHALVKYIDSLVSYGKQGAVEALKGSPVEGALARVRGVLSTRLKTKAPEYAKAAAGSREFFNLHNWAKTKLGDISGAKAERLVERINKLPEADKEMLKRISDAVPNKLKFWDWVLDLGTKEELGKIAGGNPLRQVVMQFSKVAVPAVYYPAKAVSGLGARLGSRVGLPVLKSIFQGQKE